jgi:hypothetical protein
MAVKPLGFSDQPDPIGVDHDRTRRREREGQNLRDVAQARPDQDAADPLVLHAALIGLHDRLRQARDRL